MPDKAENSILLGPTFREVLHGPEWPKDGLPLSDGRKVLDARSGYQVQRANGVGFHVCLDDGTCQGGRGDERVRLND